ncbi:hypothetical protein GCM10009718_17740 [Isoptericola halotolerans]|uniref:DNA-binding transcriptional MerR regulator n=1 Tax=Isoptericola halotolerans TaxID=300560 RepID=A0ABX2A6Z3_9MICO|nr:MerR family transcriptional regulator [Isoptericola halotolerans]NOV98639.1 DNA-binding transcriptional MerR regulator [Isoptericola halotolerans]
MSINELATLHGLTPATIRHYEKLGLFDHRHVARRPNGYRAFSPLASERLQLIRLGRLVGFTLREMAGRLRHWDDGSMTVEEKKTVLGAQLSQVRTRIDELRDIEGYLEKKIAKECPR